MRVGGLSISGSVANSKEGRGSRKVTESSYVPSY